MLHEWREPRHDAFQARNAWSLFNAFTEALKGNLVELPRRTEALHGLLDTHVGLDALRGPPSVPGSLPPWLDFAKHVTPGAQLPGVFCGAKLAVFPGIRSVADQ